MGLRMLLPRWGQGIRPLPRAKQDSEQRTRRKWGRLEENPVLDLNIDFNFDSTSPSSLSGVLDNSSVTGISADFTTNYNSTITTTGTVKFEGNKIYVRQFGTYYPQIEISTDKEISFEGLSFDHYHNHPME